MNVLITKSLIVEPILYWANAKAFGLTDPKKAAVQGLSKEVIYNVVKFACVSIVYRVALFVIQGNDPSMSLPAFILGRRVAFSVAGPVSVIAGLIGGFLVANKIGFPVSPREAAYLFTARVIEGAILGV